ncbi:MAG: hypothetical protein Kow00121_31660 [Elainellaceae cyanobacterium]
MDIGRSLSSGLSKQLIDPIISPLRDWLVSHPVWYWLFGHPLWLLGLVVLVLFLFAGLMGAIARLTEAVWLAVLQAPVRLLQWIFMGTLQLLKLPFSLQNSTVKAEAPPVQSSNQQERLTTLLSRLEALRQEQDELMKEVQALVQTNSSLTSTQSLNVAHSIEPLSPATQNK